MGICPRQWVGRRAYAKLAGSVHTPGPDRSITLQCQVVFSAGRYCYHLSQARHLSGCRDPRDCEGGCRYANLSVVVVSPRPDSPVGSECEGMFAATRNSDHFRKAGHSLGDSEAMRTLGSEESVAELSSEVVA